MLFFGGALALNFVVERVYLSFPGLEQPAQSLVYYALDLIAKRLLIEKDHHSLC